MLRRDFISILGAATATWPATTARAQQPTRVRRIGVLMQIAETDPEARARVGALVQGLRELGWAEDRDFRIEYRGTAGGLDQARALAAELVALTPDVILAVTAPIVQELQRQTRTIPIVFVGLGVPVESGVVPSLSHPGGSTTGFSGYESSIGGKWLEVLKEAVPSISRVLALVNPGSPQNQGFLRAVESSAPLFGVQVTSAVVRDSADMNTAIDSIAREPNVGLIAMPGGPITAERKTIIATALQHRLPAVYGFRYYAVEGGLMAYGAEVVHMWRRAASYVDRILKGEKPGELPVQAPERMLMAGPCWSLQRRC